MKYNQETEKGPEIKLFCGILPTNLKHVKKIRKGRPSVLVDENYKDKTKYRSLCVRATRWTEDALEELHNTLKSLVIRARNLLEVIVTSS